MKMKKILGVTLAAVMLIGTLAGCNNNEEEKTGAAAVYEDSEETLTLKWLGFPGWETATEGSAPELAIEEKFNVEIEPIFYEYSKYNTQKTNLLASGEIPDLMYQMDPVNLHTDVEQDFIAELPYETIKEYAPELSAYITDYAGAAWLYTYYDGSNWGLPNWSNTHMLGANSIWRKDWLDKFGLEVPETLDEMHDAFVKFAKEDPDGNGKDDTYGMTVMNGAYHSYFTEIFGAYGVLPFNWQEVDGEIVYGGTREETKEALKTLAAWYSEGLIHPDFVTGGNSADNFFTTGSIGYRYVAMGKAYQNSADNSSIEAKLKANNPTAEIAIGYMPKGPNGDHGIFAWGEACHIVSLGNGEGYEKKVPRLLKIFEGMFTDEALYEKVALGEEGETWEKLSADTTGADGWSFIGDNKNTTDAKANGYSPDGYATAGVFNPFPASNEKYHETKSEAYKAWYAEYGDPESSLTDVFYKPDIVDSAADYMSELRSSQMKYIAQIIIGEKTVDDYDEFIAEWERAGGATMLEEAKALGGVLDNILAELEK